MPLTLCRLEPDTEVCIARAGDARVRPDRRALRDRAARRRRDHERSGPCTSSWSASLEGVARAKGELIAALPRGRHGGRAGRRPELEPYLRDDLERRARRRGRATLELATAAASAIGARPVELELHARAHQAENALAALAAYGALGLPLDRARTGAPVEFSRWRDEELALPGGGLLINDAWNANPISMRAALAHLAERAGGRRRVAVLGEMAELGAGRAGVPPRGRRARPTPGVDVARRGRRARRALRRRDGRWVRRRRRRGATLLARAAASPATCVLVKGSRAVGLERRRARTLAAVTLSRVLIAAGSSRWSSRSSLGPQFIAFLRRSEFGQQIREEGPEHHIVKQGTPTMGGVLIVLAAAIAVPRSRATTRCRR